MRAQHIPTVNHTVKAGETLYRISVDYGVTVAQILELNPDLAGKILQTGQVVRIPDALQMRCRAIHTAKRKETLYGIAREYGITVKELMDANPWTREEGYKLRRGDELCIPYPQTAMADSSHVAIPTTIASTHAQAGDTLRIGVLLPLTTGSSLGKSCVEYYRGLLMAAERAKAEGMHLVFYTYDEPAEGVAITDQLSRLSEYKPHLIVAPVHAAHQTAAADMAARTGTALFFPFSSRVKEVLANPHILLMNVPDTTKQRVTAVHYVKNFKGRENIFLPSASGAPSSLVEAMRKELTANSERTHTLSASATADDVVAIVRADAPIMLIANDNSKASLEQITTLSHDLRTHYPNLSISLFGYPEWLLEASGTARDELRETEFYIASNFYFNETDAATADFATRYEATFGEKMMAAQPRMALLGYDTGMRLFSALHTGGTAFSTSGKYQEGLQSPIHFERITPQGGWVNTALWVMQYPAGSL